MTDDDLDRHLQVLGLARGASLAEIRAAFHGMALRHHPDRNRGDAQAAARFAEALIAYQALRAGAGPAPDTPLRARPMPTATPTEVTLGLSLLLGIGVLGVRLLSALYRKRRDG